jgi:hypothetical protein
MLDQAQLWLACDGQGHIFGVVVTAVAKHTLCVHMACGRKLSHWIEPAAQRLSEFALARKIERIRVYCRKGWVYYGKRLELLDIPFSVHRDIPLVEPEQTPAARLRIGRHVPQEHFLAARFAR